MDLVSKKKSENELNEMGNEKKEKSREQDLRLTAHQSSTKYQVSKERTTLIMEEVFRHSVWDDSPLKSEKSKSFYR